MGYYNYHAKAKGLIAAGKLKGWYYAEKHGKISPSLILMFDDIKHPIMPIREYRFYEYMPLLPADKQVNP